MGIPSRIKIGKKFAAIILCASAPAVNLFGKLPIVLCLRLNSPSINPKGVKTMPTIPKSELLKLQKSLKTDQAIGRKYKVTRQAIHQLRKRYGIPAILGKNKERDAKILSLHKKGISVMGIAKKMVLSVSQTYRIIRTFGQKKRRK
jgi:hypothetical protein